MKKISLIYLGITITLFSLLLVPTESALSSIPQNSNSHKCGAIPIKNSISPENSYPVSKNSVPNSWDWRNSEYKGSTGNWMTPVKNQGSCGSCWDFAAHAALETSINMKNKKPSLDEDLSEQYILSCYSGGTGCDGGNAYYAFQYMKNNGGAIPESCFPYHADDTIPCSYKCDDWRDKLSPIHDYGYWSEPNREFIKSQLIEKGPLCTLMCVYDDFHNYNGGIYEHPGEEPTEDINHQVVIVGYNDEGNYWICKNSWGKNWGSNGYFKIAYEDCKIEHEIVYVTLTDNFPPSPLEIEGATSGEAGKTYEYTFETTDPEGDDVYYWIEWGDNDPSSGWKGPYNSGKKLSLNHKWEDEGGYTIKAKAKDSYGHESQWTKLEITMPKSIATEKNNPNPNPINTENNFLNNLLGRNKMNFFTFFSKSITFSPFKNIRVINNQKDRQVTLISNFFKTNEYDNNTQRLNQREDVQEHIVG